MKYYYTLHGFTKSLRSDKYYDLTEYTKKDNGYSLDLKNRYRDYLDKRSEPYELLWKQDVRRFEELGYKEIDRTFYEWVCSEEPKILASRREKDWFLIKKFLPESFMTGWHRPFCKGFFPTNFNSRNKCI